MDEVVDLSALDFGVRPPIPREWDAECRQGPGVACIAHVGKPQAGSAYTVRMSFGRVPVATSALAVRCRAKLPGKRMRGSGEIAGHTATCTWSIPAGASGKHLVVRVKVSGRHGVTLVRRAHLIVG